MPFTPSFLLPSNLYPPGNTYPLSSAEVCVPTTAVRKISSFFSEASLRTRRVGVGRQRVKQSHAETVFMVGDGAASARNDDPKRRVFFLPNSIRVPTHRPGARKLMIVIYRNTSIPYIRTARTTGKGHLSFCSTPPPGAPSRWIHRDRNPAGQTLVNHGTAT